MVGPTARVLFRSPPELRPGRDQNLVRLSMRGDALVEGADGGLDLRTTCEAKRLLVLDYGHGRLQIAQRSRHVGRSACAAGERMPVGVISLREGASQPAIDLAPRRVSRLPDADRLEVRKGRVRIAHALHDGDLAFVP